MSEELCKVAKQQMGLLKLIEVKQLEALIKEKDLKIEELERRVDDLEQYTRMEDLVIYRLETTHRTYAWITAGDKEGEDAPRDELHTWAASHQPLQQQRHSYRQSKYSCLPHYIPKTGQQAQHVQQAQHHHSICE